MKKLLLFTQLVLTCFAGFSIGQWTEYLSYNSAQKVIVADGKVYCVANGGLFCFDKADNSVQKLNMISGMSDVGVVAIGYGEQSDVVIVAYQNSNLDLIYSGQVYNMSDIKRKQISGDKSIYNILVVDQVAYLSCGFGIVAVNLEKREIKDTYYIGDNAAQIRVNDMAFDGNYLYAATENGLYKADINSPNLQYYGNWEKQSSLPNADSAFDQADYFDDKLIVNQNSESWGGDALYAWDGSSWSRYLASVTQVQDLQVSVGQLVVSSGAKVEVYNPGNQLAARVSSYEFNHQPVSSIAAQSAVTDAHGVLWVADASYSLVQVTGASFEQIQPEGPASNAVFALAMNGSDLWLADGGRTSVWNNMFYTPRFQLLRDEQWQPFDGQTFSQMSGFHDIVCVLPDPSDPDHVFAGSWGGGVLEFQDDQFVARYNNKNSSLQTAIPSQPDEPYCRVSDMKFDSNGNLWVVNSIVDEPLSVLRTSGEWESFTLSGVQSSTDLGTMVMTEDDDMWITVPRRQNTMIVRNAGGAASKRLSVVAYYNNGSNEVYTNMTDIYSIAIDQDGAIWFGTAVGVGVYYNPQDIWDGGAFYASRPGLDEGDGLYHPLLSTQTVTAIAVDGANRKWFGTKTSGVYLISEDGTEELLHFTTDDSPLLSDEITSLAINDQTGEVFIGTSKGLISYMGSATSGNDDYQNVYAYPNPVREDYDGDVVITGLMEDTDLKITDISGNLVYKTTSLGGQASWDGRNLRGHRVATGVYLVFGNDRYGEQSFVTKILFIH
ncbi:two-component regulator propeller domain-containing protein [Mangrovibacterium marinum]|uniref:Putative secreted protein (Por secretion system target) n=1 Tax=Mangrovibacterium marinum TaxID=1639118 RepID=A0A2T5C2V8_9BACT|nr:two-component regulator propeller domain-containing protein [Mangrovibacterium marinum]PTN09083.1 putative secreted protein (Por secretion system target) [Mangrovibacterium marinum]